MNRILTILIFTLSLANANAQSGKIQRIYKFAKLEYKQLRYSYAIPLYKKYLSEVPTDTSALRDLFMSYKKVNQFDSALLYAEKAMKGGFRLNTTIAELYASAGNYEKAKLYYKNLLDSQVTKVAEAKLYGYTHSNTFLADSLDYKVFNTKLNSFYNESNGVFYKEGLVFESNRIQTTKNRRKLFKSNSIKTEFAWDGAGFTKLYFYPNIDSVRGDSIVSNKWKDKQLAESYSSFSNQSPNDTKKPPKRYGFVIQKYDSKGVKSFDVFKSDKLNIGAVSFTADGKKAYYTKNQKKSKGVYQLEIWEATNYNGKWVNAHKMFFNNSNYSYFHPAITPNGKRLYYVSDDNSTGYGGTDIYYIDQHPDGSWKNTVNIGQDINTEGNELFPTFYDESLYFSSNGHPGLGGLDIYQIQVQKNGDLNIKNVGYPINSIKDDFAFSVKGGKGFFTTNRYGSDDILAYNFNKFFIKMKGQINVDSSSVPGKKIYLYEKYDNSVSILIDSAIVDANSGYEFSVRPNKKYELVAFDELGNKFSKVVSTEGYRKQEDTYTKDVAFINIPIAEKEKMAKLLADKVIKDAEVAMMSKSFTKTIDSLKTLTKLYVELHHPFDQVYIVEKDLVDYYKVIELVKRTKNKKIIIVSAADCVGSAEYNEDLSTRRANRIFKTLSKLSNNEVVIKNVGERELLSGCKEDHKNTDDQLINRYSYVFIIDKK